MTDKKTLLERLSSSTGEGDFYEKLQEYLNSLDYSYGLKSINCMNVITGKENDGNVFLLIFTQFTKMVESAVDTTKYSDDELLDLLRMVKVVYDTQILVGSFRNVGKLNPFDVSISEKRITFVPKCSPLLKFPNDEPAKLMQEFVTECNEMFLTIILAFKNYK